MCPCPCAHGQLPALSLVHCVLQFSAGDLTPLPSSVLGCRGASVRFPKGPLCCVGPRSQPGFRSGQFKGPGAVSQDRQLPFLTSLLLLHLPPFSPFSPRAVSLSSVFPVVANNVLIQMALSAVIWLQGEREIKALWRCVLYTVRELD